MVVFSFEFVFAGKFRLRYGLTAACAPQAGLCTVSARFFYAGQQAMPWHQYGIAPGRNLMPLVVNRHRPGA